MELGSAASKPWKVAMPSLPERYLRPQPQVSESHLKIHQNPFQEKLNSATPNSYAGQHTACRLYNSYGNPVQDKASSIELL